LKVGIRVMRSGWGGSAGRINKSTDAGGALVATTTKSSTPAATGIVKSVESNDLGSVLTFGDSSTASTLVVAARPNIRGAERRLKAFHDVYSVLLRADGDDVSTELYGVNHNGEVHRPVPLADALGLWELGVPIRVERSAA
jgi:hypothetical protein